MKAKKKMQTVANTRWLVAMFRRLAWCFEILLFFALCVLLEGSRLADDWRFYVLIALGMVLYFATETLLVHI
jgi:hypothetical protein